MPAPRYVGEETNDSPLVWSRLNSLQIPKVDVSNAQEIMREEFDTKATKVKLNGLMSTKVRSNHFEHTQAALARFESNAPIKTGGVIALNAKGKVPYYAINSGPDLNVAKVHVCPQNLWVNNPFTMKSRGSGLTKVITWEIPATHRPNLLIFQGYVGARKSRNEVCSIEVRVTTRRDDGLPNNAVSGLVLWDKESMVYGDIAPYRPEVYTGKVYAHLLINTQGKSMDVELFRDFYLTCTEFPAF